MDEAKDVYYSVKTSNGTFKARKHVYNGKTYVHRELDADGFDELGIMLIDADILSVIKMTPEGSVDANPGIVISHLFKKKMIRPFLSLLLEHEDGTKVAASEFSGTAGAYVSLFWEVAESFFTMNPVLMSRLQELFVGTVGAAIAGGQIMATLLAGANSAGLSQSTDRKPTQ